MEFYITASKLASDPQYVCSKNPLKKKAFFYNELGEASVVFFLFLSLPQEGNKHFTFR